MRLDNFSLSNRSAYLLAVLLLGAMFLLAFFSMKGDALTFDELAHIPAGYSYLTKQDYRINPEHPPLAKDLAALPLLFLNLNFPSEHPAWTQNENAPQWWVQFDLGTEFLYRSGNNPKTIIFWSRIPMIVLLCLTGWLLFKFARNLGGNWMAIGALMLFAFSPTFLAHGRLVTTDVAAVLGTILATSSWLRFLQNPTKGNILIAGVALGIALLLKFTLMLLIPLFALLVVIHALLSSYPRISQINHLTLSSTITKNMADRLSDGVVKTMGRYVLCALLAGVVAMVFVIWPVYYFHTLHYPAERQLRDTIADLAPEGIKPYEQFLAIEPIANPLLRPLAQFFRGIFMAMQRTSFGNTVYFLGKISGSGWWYYFPIIYLAKESLTFHILTLLALAGLFWALRKVKMQNLWKHALFWTKEHFSLFSCVLFIGMYWAVAMIGNLNIGVRHLLPVFPFTYILVLWGIKRILAFAKILILKRGIFFLAVFFLLWHISSAIGAFPHYISYYNEFTGGRSNGYKTAVDSNYDWGQDFYRLLNFVKENDVEKLHLDYFGGESPAYWLGEKYIKLNPKATKTAPKGWIAVSVNQLMGGIAKPIQGFDQATGYYNWLLQHAPVARAGSSIFIYHVE